MDAGYRSEQARARMKLKMPKETLEEKYRRLEFGVKLKAMKGLRKTVALTLYSKVALYFPSEVERFWDAPTERVVLHLLAAEFAAAIK